MWDIITGVIPTALTSIVACPDGKVAKDSFFTNLQCLGDRSIMAGWYSQADDALRAKDWQKVLKLFEAALCIPMQVRCAPSLQQVNLDSMTYSEDLYSAIQSNSDAFLTFAEKFVACFPADFLNTSSQKVIVTKARLVGISYHGAAVAENVARSLKNLAPYVTSAEFKKAFKEFAEVSSVLNDQSKLSMLLFACTTAHGKGNPASLEAAVAIIRALRSSLVHKDITKHNDLTAVFLVGGRAKAGFAHVMFKRKVFVDLIKVVVEGEHGQFAKEAEEKIFPKLSSSSAVETHFTVHVRPADSAVGEIDDEDGPDPEALNGVGLSVASMTKFNEFADGLTTTGKLLANLLWKTAVGLFDDEFRDIASHELACANFAFPWGDLFISGTKENKVQKKVGGVDCPGLGDACKVWIQSSQKGPSALGEDQPSRGRADKSFSKACNTDDGSFEAKRDDAHNALDELFATKVQLSCMPENNYQTSAIMQAVTQARKDRPKGRVAPNSAVGEATTGVKAKGASTSAVDGGDTGVIEQERVGTMYICFAELFPGHEKIMNPETFRGLIPRCSEEFKDLVKILLKAAQKDDVVIVSDGRSYVVQKEIRAVFTEHCQEDEWMEIWVIYDLETTMRQDVRNPKRKLAWGSHSCEILFVRLPRKTKGQRKLVPRDMYTKCGESTNFSRSYSGVAFRNLSEIPRLTDDAKKAILGNAAVGAFDRERVDKEVSERGHPILWGEWKPVNFYSTLIRDFQIHDVVDLTPGSGAACIASLYSKAPYSGIAYNEKHEEWLRSLLAKMFLAMVVSNEVVAEQDLVKNVTTYLKLSADAATQMLPKFAPPAVDSYTGKDDSDREE